MSDGNELAFLDETQPEAPTPEVAQEAAPEPEPQVATGETEAEPPSAPEESTRPVPITALLDEREKRQEAQRKAEEAERRLREMERQLAALQQPQPVVDFKDNPQAAIEQRLLNERLNTSELVASQAHGADVVETAKAAFVEAARKDPTLLQQAHRQVHPYDFVVKWHKQQTLLSQMGPDPDAWINAQVEARLQERLAQSPAPKAPPPSMARAPAAGRDATKPGNAFDALFSS